MGCKQRKAQHLAGSFGISLAKGGDILPNLGPFQSSQILTADLSSVHEFVLAKGEREQ